MTTGKADPRVRTHLRLQAALQARFVAAGWVTDDNVDCSVGELAVAAFRRPIRDGLMVTAMFDRHTDEVPFGMMVTIGVAYEPLDRLWPLLTDEPLDDPIFHDVTGSDDGVVVGDERDVETAADTLARILLGRVESYVREYGSINALLAANRSPDVDTDTERYMVPALLAAACRVEEARAALTTYQPSRVSAVFDRDYRQFSQRLTHWLDSGGTVHA